MLRISGRRPAIGFVFSTNRVAASKPKALGMAEWKLQFGFVFQRTFKFSGEIRHTTCDIRIIDTDSDSF